MKNKDRIDSEQKPLTITETSTVFFHGKFCDAFPGLRNDCVCFASQKEIGQRLDALLSYPTYFQECCGHKVVTDPIWWFRGGSSLYIEEYKKIKRRKILLGVKELIIEKIVACRGKSYYQDFIYVQCKAEKPTKLYKYEKNEIENYFHKYGYYAEEYALFNGKKISRQEYDDGSAMIKGKLKQAFDAELRERYLTKYNFVIAAKFSPYNSKKFSSESKHYFDGLLREEISFDDFLVWMRKLQKHDMDD